MGGEGGHDEILLHVEAHDLVHEELAEFPQHADRHGEAEGHERLIDRREVHAAGMPVQQVDHGETDGCGQKAGQGVEHRVPSRDQGVVVVDLSEDRGGVDEAVDDDLEERRDLDPEALLRQRGHQEQE